jgi:hypothetical protein
MRLPALFVLLSALCACTTLPEIDDSVTPEAEAADYPTLQPVETIFARVEAAERDEAAERAALDARVRALEDRAEALRGDVLDADTRARLAATTP